jgi:hypothetical protein
MPFNGLSAAHHFFLRPSSPLSEHANVDDRKYQPLKYQPLEVEDFGFCGQIDEMGSTV